MVPATPPLVRRSRPANAKARVRAVLATLYVTNGATIVLRQDQIGALADCVREVASRALAELEREGVIRQGRGSVTILDPSRLDAEGDR